jgi:class 3 adenylate cyclase
VVAFLETSSDELAVALAGAGAEIIQRLDTLVVAAFGSAELAMRLCAALPRDVRAGLSCGDVLYEDGALHGLPVIEASRLRDLAAPGQILCAGRLLHVGDAGPESSRSVGDLEIRGLPERLAVRELVRPD